MTGDEIVAAAREYLGTPFRHQGRVRGSGVDCVGLLVGVAQQLGIAVADRTNYNGIREPGEITAALEDNCREVPIHDAQPGDVVVFWLRRPSGPDEHVAILTDHGIIHARQRRGGGGRVVETGLSDNWRKRIMSAWRF